MSFLQKKKYILGYRKRIIISMLIFLVAVFVPLVVYGILTDRGILKEHLEQNGIYLVKNLALNSELGVFSENAAYLKTPLEAILEQPDVLCAAVYSHRGSIISYQAKAGGSGPPLPDDIQSLMHSWPQSSVRIRLSSAAGSPAVDFFAPVHLKNQLPNFDNETAQVQSAAGEQIGIARVGISLSSLAGRTREIILTAAFMATIYFGLAVCAILFIARSIANPVHRISEAAHKIGSGELGTRIAVDARDELGDLALSFNNMTDQLQQQMDKRRQVQEELQESQAYNRMLFADSHIPLIVMEPDTWQYTDCNDAAVRIYGYASRDEVLGKTPLDMSAPTQYDGSDSRTGVQERIRTGIEQGITVFEWRHQRPDGEMWDGEVHLMCFHHKNKIFLQFSLQDITERRRMEETLRESEQHIRTISNNLANGMIYQAIRLNDAARKFTYLSDAVREFYGITPQEGMANANHIYDRIHEEDRDRIHKEEELANETLSIFKSEARVINHKGEMRWSSFVSRPKKLPDGTTCWDGIEFDITERKQLEENLRQSQKMEAIGTLAGGIAHDFNNILAAIMGYTELSLDAVPPESPLQRNLQQVLKASHRARDLVKQILAFSRKDMEARKPLLASPIIRESIKLLRASIPATIDIRADIEDETCMIQSTPTHISQLLMNLCTNAAQAMSDSGGVLHIGLSHVLLDKADAAAYTDLTPGDYLKLTVSDTGTGIDKKIIERIFEPFFTTKEIGKGTGMGLAVVHGIVKSHEGAVRVHSEPGSGSTFVVLLPCRKKLPCKESVEEQLLPQGGERILFIDDEELIVQVAGQLLESLGYTVRACESSLEALEIFGRDPSAFDLVITDETMPQMTGHMLIGKLLAIRPDIPVILSTGYSEKVSDENAQSLGFKAFVMKPLNRRELAETVRSVLDGRWQV